jgi:hypothetical protein
LKNQDLGDESDKDNPGMFENWNLKGSSTKGGTDTACQETGKHGQRQYHRLAACPARITFRGACADDQQRQGEQEPH